MVEENILQKYGKWAILAFLSVSLVYGGYLYYINRQNTTALAASTVYDSMMAAVQKSDKKIAKREALSLIETYPKTSYGNLAYLTLAKIAMEERDLKTAADNLRKVISAKNDFPFQHIARIRLSRVLAAEKNYEDALEILSIKTDPGTYLTLYEEAKGDIYLLQNEKAKAALAYQAAMKALPAEISQPRLQLKLTDLGIKESS